MGKNMKTKELTDRDITELLSQLNDKLRQNDKTASILLSGGATMALMFNRNRLTQDIDAVLLNGDKSGFRKIVAEVGLENELKEDWLNEAVKGYIDFNWKKQFVPTGFSNLTVYHVPADKLLAMKLTAGRAYSKDKEDAINLMKYLDINSIDEVTEILENSIPNNLLTAKTRYFTMEVFDEYTNYKSKTMEAEKMSKENLKEKVYLNVHNNFAKIGIESKFGNGQTFNAVTIPKGSVVDGKDIGGGTIYPLDMYIYKNKFNDNLTTVQFRQDQEVQINFKNGEHIKVKAEDLCEAVTKANKEYLDKNKNIEKSKIREKNKDNEMDI